MTMAIVNKAYPPNYQEIVKVLPGARGYGVIFSYGDKIYVPTGRPLEHHLKVHEAVHGIRQKELGVEFWWRRYLNDKVFRYHEELVAHRAEYLSRINEAEGRNQRRVILKQVAMRLAAPLYGCGGGWKKAADDILQGAEKKEFFI